jgi:hypothetical protein
MAKMLLREYVRLVLGRRLVVEAAEGDDMAIYVLGGKDNGVVVAYRMGELEAALEGEGQHPYAGVEAGGMAGKQFRLGPCNDSAVVGKSASNVKGWGTRVYLAAMEHFGSLAPDRSSVSPSAVGMWKSLKKNGWVKGDEFDDIEDAWTPPEEDDCKVHPQADKAFLNYSYRLAKALPSDVSAAMERGQRHMEELKGKGVGDKAMARLKSGFLSLFTNKYD